MLTVKVVTEYHGTQTPNFDGYVRPAEHIFEATSVYDDAGVIYCHGVPDGGSPDSKEPGTVTYQACEYQDSWTQTMYVMNSSGATISKFRLGWCGGDIGCHARIAPNPWHKIDVRDGQPLPDPDCPESPRDDKSREEQTGLAAGATAG